MMHIRITIVVTLLLSLASKSTAQKTLFDESERTIIRLQDDRRGVDTIVQYLSSPKAKVAWRAAIALANIKDTTTRKPLIAHLKKENPPSVSEAIEFALGVLGPNAEVFKALSTFTEHGSSVELFIALGRTATKEDIPQLAEILRKKTTPARAAVGALIEISMHKLLDEELAKIVDELTGNDDPEVLWRAVYSFARCEDSTLLSHHIPAIKAYLGDIGSPETRMFAVTALGRIHNEESASVLINAARSEVEWRVRVNIFNAIAKLPRYSSAIHAVIKKAVTESLTDSLTSNHVARAALDALDQMIAAGKITSPDSVSIKEWLSDYIPNRELYQDQSVLIRSQAMIPLARFGADYEGVRDIVSFLSYHNRSVDINVWKAVGVIPDTLTFFFGINRVFATSASDLNYLLDALHSIWELAKKDSILFSKFETFRYASLYRHMLIRFASQTEDPAIVANTMEQIKDPVIVTDSLRSEAEEYLLQYVDRYAFPRYHDQLNAVLSAIAWLKPTNPAFGTRIEAVMNKAASEWGDGPL
ncbi:MAG: HEAT repeat domain-containing protein, partial [Ignavibacteriota bacterium]